MNKLFFITVLAVGLLVSGSSIAQTQSLWTQELTNSTAEVPTAHGNTVTLSGCLGRGSAANEYSIRAWTVDSREVKSDSINLGGYLSKTVMIVAVQPSDPQAPLNVVSLRFLSNACETWY